jgi:hypothetical protein
MLFFASLLVESGRRNSTARTSSVISTSRCALHWHASTPVTGANLLALRCSDTLYYTSKHLGVVALLVHLLEGGVPRMMDRQALLRSEAQLSWRMRKRQVYECLIGSSQSDGPCCCCCTRLHMLHAPQHRWFPQPARPWTTTKFFLYNWRTSCQVTTEMFGSSARLLMRFCQQMGHSIL